MGFLVRSACVTLLFLTAVTPGSSAQTTPLRLVSTPWPPFTSDAGQPRFALDLVESALGRIGMSAKTTLVDAALFTQALLTGEFDGSGAAWKDAERERVLVFSQPYLENRLILVGRKGSNVSATALSDLRGKRVAIVGGYAYGDAVNESGAMTFVRSRGEEDSLALLLARKADYALMDELVIQYIINNYPNEAKQKLNLGTWPLVKRQLHFAVRRSRPDAESIVRQFNAQLRGMIADGTYHRLLHVPWISADIDGDGVAEFIPQSDRSGAVQPKYAYELFSDRKSSANPFAVEPQRRFYVGGNIYTDWASVPNRYKVEDPQYPDSRRSTATVFQFRW